MARCDDREYCVYSRKEQRSQAGCSGGRMQQDLRYETLARELVAEPVHREDELRVPGIRFDLLTQPGDVHVHRSGGRNGVVAPDLVQQLLSRERRAAMLDEVTQQSELPRGELDELALVRH